MCLQGSIEGIAGMNGVDVEVRETMADLTAARVRLLYMEGFRARRPLNRRCHTVGLGSRRADSRVTATCSFSLGWHSMYIHKSQ